MKVEQGIKFDGKWNMNSWLTTKSELKGEQGTKSWNQNSEWKLNIKWKLES